MIATSKPLPTPKARRRGALASTVLAGLLSTGCTFVGLGEGEVYSDRLVVDACWSESFDLQPDFFAAVPFRDVMQLRVQRGSDLQEFSDGVALLVNDVSAIRNEQLGTPLRIGIAPELLDEIAPGGPAALVPPVSLALYLQFSCHNQNVVLYGVDGTITFNHLFSGDPNESVGADKLTEANFEVRIADPRHMDRETREVPEDKLSTLKGYFRFHFQRGKPGQPFP